MCLHRARGSKQSDKIFVRYENCSSPIFLCACMPTYMYELYYNYIFRYHCRNNTALDGLSSICGRIYCMYKRNILFSHCNKNCKIVRHEEAADLSTMSRMLKTSSFIISTRHNFQREKNQFFLYLLCLRCRFRRLSVL